MTHCAHWGLSYDPFADRLDIAGLHRAPAVEEALARCEHLVRQRSRLGLLLGEGGLGKSLVLKAVQREMRAHVAAVTRLSISGAAPVEFLWDWAVDWGLNPDPAADAVQLFRALGDALQELAWQQSAAVLLLDDVEQATTETLEALGRVLALCAERSAVCTIILALRPSGLRRLPERLLETCELKCELRDWSLADAQAYLSGALARAGRASAIFTPAAIVRLHALSGGSPRQLLHFGRLALVAGASLDLTQIDEATLESVCRELGSLELPPMHFSLTPVATAGHSISAGTR